MPGEGLTHGPPAEEKQAAVTTGAAGSSGIPCAMFDGLYVLSLETGLIASIRVMRNIITSRQRSRVAQGASTGAPGPHDFTVRIEMFVGARNSRCNPTRPPHPAPDVRDDARTSLCMGRDGNNKSRFPKKRKRKFAAERADARDRVERVGEMSFSAQAVLRLAQLRSGMMLLPSETMLPGNASPNPRMLRGSTASGFAGEMVPHSRQPGCLIGVAV